MSGDDVALEAAGLLGSAQGLDILVENLARGRYSLGGLDDVSLSLFGAP